jgi:FecR protein
MTTRVPRRDSFFFRKVLLLLLLCHAGLAAGQPVPTPFVGERLPSLVMVMRADPADPARYIGVFGRDLSDAVAIYREGRGLVADVPQFLQRGDEIETSVDVVAVIRYPAGNVYIAAATRARIGSLDVLFGKVFARVRGLFSVESQNVVAGVEGTEFAFEVAGDGTVHVTVLDGAVRCSSRTLNWNAVHLARDQAFAATDSTRDPRVAQADPVELAQLRSWVRRVDDAIALPTPPSPSPQPPTPSPPPTPPPPPIISVPPLPPAPPAQFGYCCEAGRVFATTLGGCRGNLYDTQAEAYRQCRPVTRGYCCANGQVFPSVREECRGIFSLDQARAQASCAQPPWQPPPQDQPGFCCSKGEVTTTTRDRCHGYFFADEASARKRCAPPQLGYCCVGGQLLQTNREQCRGSFFTDLAGARRGCVAPPEQGYCCSGGRVSQTTRDRCAGTFSRVQDEAQRMCKREPEIRIDKGVVTRPPRDYTPR